jgi:Ca2+-binding EF-hand superfamily protein
MYPSGIGTSFHDPLTTSFNRNQSLNFHSGRPLLKDYKQESGHVHPILSGADGASIRRGRGIQYTNGVTSFDGSSRPNTSSATQRYGLSPRSVQGKTFSTGVGTPGGSHRTYEGFGGATWSSRPSSAYPSYGRRYADLMQRSRPSSGVPNNPPKWLALDKQMLSFEAYFKEVVDESRLETYRVRRCVLQYYLEDDSIKITEPREENSGIPQGAFLKRHRVPKGDGEHYTWRDIDVATEMTFYGRTFRITNCDQRTREFYRAKGIELSGSEGVPEDPVRAASRPPTATARPPDDHKKFMEARLGKCMDNKEEIAQFLANDRKVLRFFCFWDDRGLGGDSERREFRLHYFLADDTVEVLEVNRPNSGRDPWPALLKRMKLPKVWSSNARENTNFYKAADFRLGDTITIFGRKVLLYDCDKFTREYYQETFGADMERIPVPEKQKRVKTLTIPPHMGIGREEDSIMNVLSLHPKPPRQNVMRRLQNKSNMLRFVAKLKNAVGFDRERVFTVNYHLDTDDISVFEPVVRNSGRTGGKFMDKQKIKKPDTGAYYRESDFHVGAEVHCFGRLFDLLDADLYTLNYMAAHPETFPMANPEAISNKVASFGDELLDTLETRFRGQDVMASGQVPPGEFRETLSRACPALNSQEVLTLQRSFEEKPGGNINYAAMLGSLGSRGSDMGGASDALLASNNVANDDTSLEGAVASIRRQVQRRGPAGMRGLARAFSHADEAGDRLLGPMTFRETLGRVGLTVSDGAVAAIFDTLAADEPNGHNVIDYATVLDALCGELSTVREQAARQAYVSIDRNHTGAILMEDVVAKFEAARHPAVLARELTPDEARAELADCFEGAGARSGGRISLPEFLRIYSEIGVAFEDDAAFLDYMSNVWDIQPLHRFRRSWR